MQMHKKILESMSCVKNYENTSNHKKKHENDSKIMISEKESESISGDVYIHEI